MNPLRIATAQFEPRDGDKTHNLSVIESLAAAASKAGATAVSFHEMSVTAYTFVKDLSRDAVFALAEPVPDGPSCQRLIELSEKHQIAILAGLVERDNDRLFNTYVCMSEGRLVARFRKLHPFISPHLSPGDRYEIFDLDGWKCGILICYDNNVIENVRATTLMGANIIFAPHVTGCTPSAMPGRGYVADQLWQDRNANPDALRTEFDGPKGRGWLMRWLPARAYDNGVYYVFSNPIGYDGGHLKNGNAMILDPYGEVLGETWGFGPEIAVADITPEKLTLAGGFRYRNARRPDLYRDVLGRDHRSTTRPIWLEQGQGKG